jgi:hypothetical protein
LKAKGVDAMRPLILDFPPGTPQNDEPHRQAPFCSRNLIRAIPNQNPCNPTEKDISELTISKTEKRKK